MRRARGCGGRFLSTKKPRNNSTDHTADKDVNSGANPSQQSATFSGSEWLSKNNSRDLDSSSGLQEVKEYTSQETRDMQAQTSSNGNGNGHGQSSIYHPSSGDILTGGFLSQQRKSTNWHGVTNAALRIN